MANELSPDKPLETLAEYIKWFTTLALGGLAFGVGLQQFVADYPAAARGALERSWILFAVSAGAGILLQSAFPVLYERQQFSLRSLWLRIPYFIMAIAFALGSFFLWSSLTKITAEPVDPKSVAVKDATAVVERIRKLLPRSIHLVAVETSEIIKGAQQSALRDEVWHARIKVHDDGRPKSKRDYKVDIFIRAYDGRKVSSSP
jgi:hypothetical protein